ncbi:phosphoglycolate phosphatase [Ideonella livida]|uniref:Phosphoglycolate phosphatase n=1 Tax=Ideonella livida TaxID=2707176 RepID=A0A7C9PFI1_9BURK|nr:phosphoglycolate phosphatase [Ideonella livida]NDY90152.1 phosphoglycolate phosphatase [Ideonella livida]
MDAPDRPGAPALQAVLFDLDGTLVDSAPDLAGALNDLRAELGLAPLAQALLRPYVGTGARGMLERGLGLRPQDADFVARRDRFLDLYEARMLWLTGLFPGIQAVLDGLAAAGLPWGVVTNKATRFAEPLVRGLALMPAPGVLVCGDTTPHAKPHPEPLWHAARQLGVSPAQVLYVGDDLRDVQAGRAAGMATVAALWGYLGDGEPPVAWGADALVDSPQALASWLGIA